MLRKRFSLIPATILVLSAAAVVAQNSQSSAFRLTPRMAAGDVAAMTLSYEVGGDLIELDDAGREIRTPMSVVAKMAYDEQLVAWWPDASIASRSLRHRASSETLAFYRPFYTGTP